MPQLKIIARFRDGRIVKGTTHNFSPERRMFHMTPLGAIQTVPPVAVSVDQLKAVFVVRDFEGDPDHDTTKGDQPSRSGYGEKLEVTFEDGEVLTGVSLTYDRQAMGFFLVPADAESNNERIFVVNAAVAGVRQMQFQQP